ncbi:MAG: SDR family oxidoreductase [Alphaproteobacteria bacterium]|nr:SDR family oxidoreductase [Alphaproteobacteria bacterium]
MKKTAIITGGSKGIGAAICKYLASKGYNLCLSYNSDTIMAEKVALDCKHLGAEVHLVKGDIGQQNICQQIIDETVFKFKGLDVLVNNAATTKFCSLKSLKNLSKDEFLSILNINLVSPYFLSSFAEEFLRNSPNNPSIINISSTAGKTGIGSNIAYSASKGGLNTLTMSLAKILAPKIRVNAVSVGFVETSWWLRYFDAERYEVFKNKQKEKAALKKITLVQDVAEAVYLLITNESITGESITIDSGISIGRL